MTLNQKTFKLNINKKDYNVLQGLTLIQACNKVGLEIPRFCYHEKLTIAGNCRMCLIEISRPRGPVKPKPAAACALTVLDGMFIHTNTLLVKKARESVIEFLLINHPLDCPICDQGGECDLQDQTIVFGSDRGRFYENKRSVSDKECGPLIRTSMTRCIHCTRCVRFGNEIAGIDFFGTIGRGYFTEIGPYISEIMHSELSGNIIDICPVGALTSKPYTYKARPWELRKIETIDVLDSLCSNIRIDLRGLNIMRILPRLNESINEDWITDKTRFFYDSLSTQRLQKPLLKMGKQFFNISWKGVFLWLGFKLKKLKNIFSMHGVIGNVVDFETIIVLRDFLNKFGSSNFFNDSNFKLNIDLRNNYLLNTEITKLEDMDFCILLGFNPRLELPLLNLRLRKAVKKNNAFIVLYGSSHNLTYKFYNISNNLMDFLKFLEGKSYICRNYIKASFPFILKGTSLLYRLDCNDFSMVFEEFLKKINKKVKTINNFIINYSGFLNSFELGFSNISNHLKKTMKKINIFFLSHIDSNLFLRHLNFSDSFNNCLIISQNSIGNQYTTISDLILPCVNFLEQNVSFVNIEGRLQHTRLVQFPSGFVRSNWKVLIALAIFLKKPLKYITLIEIKKRFFEITPLIKSLVLTFNNKNYHIQTKLNKKEQYYYLAILSSYYNFYKTDLFSKNSKILNLASRKFIKNLNFYNIKMSYKE
jgi:NADH dehydrogenase (ubiquinone) Fe-S protein 1